MNVRFDNDLKNVKEKDVKASLKDLDFNGWLQFIPETFCMLLISAALAFIPFFPVVIILTSATSGYSLVFWSVIIYIGLVVITAIAAWNIHCDECKQCELQKICKKQLDEKKRLAHADYMNDRKSEIEVVHKEIERLRKYMDKLISVDNKSPLIREEVDRMLKQIAMYEDMIERYEKEVNA